MGNCCNNREKPKHIVTDDENHALSVKCKEVGNQYFSAKQFQEAIEAYSEAIRLYDKESIYYSNRGVTYRAMSMLELANHDAVMAIKLDSSNGRAHFLLGTVQLLLAQSEVNIEQANQGLIALKQAEKCSVNRPSLLQNIRHNVGTGNRLLVILQRQSYKIERDKLITLLKRLDTKGQVDFSKISMVEPMQSNPSTLECYSCIITQELFEEPVLVQSGHTYERKAILQHFELNGAVDPNTRQHLSAHMTPNQQLKCAIDNIFDNNIEFMSLFVGNLSRYVEQQDIEREFRVYGECTVDLRGKNNERYAFIQYKSQNEAGEALKSLHGKEIQEGVKINVEWSKKSGMYHDDRKDNNRGERRDDYGGSGRRGGNDRQNKDRYDRGDRNDRTDRGDRGERKKRKSRSRSRSFKNRSSPQYRVSRSQSVDSANEPIRDKILRKKLREIKKNQENGEHKD